MKVDGCARGAAPTAAVILWMAMMLSACGGGGGGSASGGGNTPPPLSVSISPLVIDLTADAGTSSKPVRDIRLTLNREPEERLLVSYQPSNGGIAHLSFITPTPTTAIVQAYFADPIVIGPGIYNGTIELKVCKPQGDICAQEISGSPRTIPVTYRVTGVQPPQPGLTATTTSVSVSALSASSTGPTASVGIHVEYGNPSRVGISAISTRNGLSHASFVEGLTRTEGTVNLSFQSPRRLVPGVYDDTVTVDVGCFDCPRPILNSPLVINVRYTVSNTVSSPDGYTLRVVDGVVANDIVWSAANGRLYASTPSSAGENPNSVVAIDPDTAEVQGSTPAGSEPGRLAVSDDGQYLYVALLGSNSIRRISLPVLTQDLLIPLGSDPTLGPYYASDLEVMPGQANTIAVARSLQANYPDAAGVVIFDGATARTDIVASPPNINWLEFGASPAALYGTTGQSTSFSVSELQVDNDGATLLSEHSGPAFDLRDLHFANGVLYGNSGQAFDPAQDLVIGTYSIPNVWAPRAIVPDASNGTVFGLGYATSGGGTLAAFDLDTFTILRSVPLNGLSSSTQSRTRLVRWGTNGLAFITDEGEVLLLNGSFVH